METATHGLWPEIARQASEASKATRRREAIHAQPSPEATFTVELTLSELRALDDLVHVGTRAIVATRRGAGRSSFPAELGSAQRKLQSVYAAIPRADRVVELDAAAAR
jgi:hypothetical protein